MPVPATMADLTTSEATNSPPDSETVTATTRPSDYLRAHAAILKTHSDSTAEHGATGAVVGTTNTQTLTNKTLDLTSNTLTGTTAQFNTALTDGDFATLAGTQTLTNKTIVAASNTITTAASGNLTSTNLNAALAELQTDIDSHKSDTAEHGATGAVVGTTNTQTLTNKSLSTGCSWAGTAIPVANGGTGSTTEANARTALGLAIGSEVQAYSANLSAVAGLAVTNGNIIVGNGTTWVAESGATARTSLGAASTASASTTASGLVELATTTEASTGTDTARAVTPEGVEAHMNANALAWGQTYQDMTASRALSTTYTNSTGRPICVSVKSTLGTGTAYTATVAGALVYEDSNGGNFNENRGMFFIVPSGSTYSVAGGTLQAWKELR